MNTSVSVELWQKYAPYVMFDLCEPFYPEAVGVSVLDPTESSPSFRRSFKDADMRTKQVIEYAIWWDYEIGHLYEMEHVWVYVGHDGEVVDCEASFHGRVLKGLLKDHSNLIEGTHVRLYSQPGKHAFSPLPIVFELLPNLYSAASQAAGMDGLLVNELFSDYFSSNQEIDTKVKEYLQSYAFVPSMEFREYKLEADLMMPWSELFTAVPSRIEDRVRELGLQLPQGTRA